MSKRVYAELPDDFVRRMRNWARWQAHDCVLGYASSAMWRCTPSGRRDDTAINVMNGEADDTDRALNGLPIRYSQAVKLFWQYESAPMTYMSKRCGAGVDYRTFEARVIEGHIRLRGELARRNDALSLQRERLEKMQLAA